MKKIKTFKGLLDWYFNPVEKAFYSNVTNKLEVHTTGRTKFLNRMDRHWYYYIGDIEQRNYMLDAMEREVDSSIKRYKHIMKLHPKTEWSGVKVVFPVRTKKESK